MLVNWGDPRGITLAVGEYLTETIFGTWADVKAAAFFSSQAAQVMWITVLGLTGALAIWTWARGGAWGLARRAIAAFAPILLVWPIQLGQGPPYPVSYVVAREAMRTGVALGGWLAHRLPQTHSLVQIKQRVSDDWFERSLSQAYHPGALNYDDYPRALQFFLLPYALTEVKELKHANDVLSKVGREIERNYYDALRNQRENWTFWSALKDSVRESARHMWKGTKIWIAKTVGAVRTVFYLPGLLENPNSQQVLKILRAAGVWSPWTLMRFALIAVGVPAFIMLWAASFYVAVLLWALRAGYFGVLFPLKAVAHSLRGDGEGIAAKTGGTVFSLIATPAILALNFALAEWGAKIYCAVVPAAVMSLYSLAAAATGKVSGVVVTPLILDKLTTITIFAGFLWGLPFAALNLILPYEIEQAVEGISHRLFPIHGRLAGALGLS